MPDIIEECVLAVSPQRVWGALTQEDGIARWWTDDLAVRPEVGSLAEFRFTRWGGGVLRFEVAELDEGSGVRWIFRQGPPHWAGTSVTWQLLPLSEGTKLVFIHAGFAQAGAAFEQTRRNWQHFLGSLKSYLETGRGTPGLPQAV